MRTPKKTRLFRRQRGLKWVKIVKVPCIFPDDQGIDVGEQFASDCIIRTRVSEAEKMALSVAKSPRARRFLSSKSRRERSIGESARRFGEIVSVSIFRRGLWPWQGDKGCSPQIGRDSSIASRLEQLNRIAVGIFNLNLFAAGTDLDFISKSQTRLF
jgi:hypothetical protein